MRKILILFFLFFVAQLGMSIAEDKEKSVLKTILPIEGQCNTLLISDTPFPCKGLVMQSNYDDNKMGFYFAAEDGKTIITFSGYPSDNGEQSLTVLDLYVVIISEKLINVKGGCVFEDLFSGVAKIQCVAKDDNGAFYRSDFLSDGQRPEYIEF